MGKTTHGTGVSLSLEDWGFVQQRLAQLSLKQSAYFQLLVDLDKAMRPTKHLHVDGTIHLFPEQFLSAVAEQSAPYAIATSAGPGKGSATPPGKPPDNSKRHRGDGPRRAVS